MSKTNIFVMVFCIKKNTTDNIFIRVDLNIFALIVYNKKCQNILGLLRETFTFTFTFTCFDALG